MVEIGERFRVVERRLRAADGMKGIGILVLGGGRLGDREGYLEKTE